MHEILQQNRQIQSVYSYIRLVRVSYRVIEKKESKTPIINTVKNIKET